jgi:hypothetical protein
MTPREIIPEEVLSVTVEKCLECEQIVPRIYCFTFNSKKYGRCSMECGMKLLSRLLYGVIIPPKESSVVQFAERKIR